jgi:hypothetical protein
MSITQRKDRSLNRDIEPTFYRDDRFFIIACDDSYAPDQYFNFFQIPRVKVIVIPTPIDNTNSSALHVLQRLKDDYKSYDEKWLLLDTDHYIYGTHVKNYNCALKEAEEAGIKVALNKPCFEIWLLLHHVNSNDVKHLKNAAETENFLKKILNGYDKTNLQENKFPQETLKNACLNAIELDLNPDNRIPAENVSRVYQIWQNILAKASENQLPSYLFELKLTLNKSLSIQNE